MAPTLLSLNYDVLSDVLEHISSHDAAHLALTCRQAYTLAFPRLLSNISIGGLFHKTSNSAVSQLKDFCNFMLAPAPSWHGPPSARLDALRSLEVMRDAVRIKKDGVWTTDASAVALLSSVLNRAQNLQKLTLWGSEALFKAYPDIVSGSSASIRTLILGGDVAPLPDLARAFPNVRQLIFIGGGVCTPEWAFKSPTVETEALGAWLESVEHIDTGFPILPLAIPARRVWIRNPIVSDIDAIQCARDFLGMTQPIVLSTAISAYASAEEVGTVLGLAASSLRYIDLVGDRCESVKDGTEWVQTHIANALSSLQDINLAGITLAVTPAMVPAIHTWKSQFSIPEPPPPEPPTTVDFVALARTVAEGSPSLQFISIDLTAARGSSNTQRACFRVLATRDGSSRQIVRVSEEEGRSIAEQMRRYNRYD